MSVNLETFSNAILALHEASTSPERWAEALGAVSSLMGANKAALFDISAPQSGQPMVVSLGHDPEMQRQYLAHYYSVDPTMQHTISAPVGTFLTVYDRFSRQLRDRNEYFEFARRADIGDVIGGKVGEQGGMMSIVSLQRPHGAPAYDAEMKRVFNLVGRHLSVALKVGNRLLDASITQVSLAAGLDRFASPALILDACCGVRHLNAAARALIAGDARFRFRAGRLSVLAGGKSEAFDRAVAAAALPRGRSYFLALSRPDGGMTELAIAPLHAAHELTGPWEQPLALVVASAPRRDGEAIARRMRRLYALSAAEARVVADLAQGLSVEEIAARNGVRVTTVRTQLRSLFEKTGTRRQAELVRLALGGVDVGDDQA